MGCGYEAVRGGEQQNRRVAAQIRGHSLMVFGVVIGIQMRSVACLGLHSQGWLLHKLRLLGLLLGLLPH